MTEIAFITDIHFGARNNNQFFLDRYEEFFNNTFFPTLDERNIKDVIILGDTWEHRKQLNLLTISRAQSMFFAPLSQRNINVKIIYGNHDCYHKNTNSINSVDFLGEMYANVEIIPETAVFNYNGTRIALVSWINSENYNRMTRFIETVPAEILAGHFEIKTFELVRGHENRSGFDKEFFNRFESVYSGHFHIQSHSLNIKYLGNPFQTNWSDFNEKKGFHILNTQTKQLEFIENSNEIYQGIHYSDETPLDFNYRDYTNNIVRVFIDSYFDVNQDRLNIFTEKLGVFAFTVEVVERNTFLLEKYKDDGQHEGIGTKELINQYINSTIDHKHFDTQTLRGMLFDLYDRALLEEVDE